ncbi:MAG TPA: hypothetical protein VN253_22955 [Kofleriaceae bacterium]|nr:hypothetical protein [Kofleriaceae bacterium]
MRPLLLLPLLASCALHADLGVESPAAPARPGAADAGKGSCARPPYASVGRYRHGGNRFYKKLGAPRFRGIDLIASEEDEVQTLGGKLAYTAADKDVEDEDVEVYACLRGDWEFVRAARTGADGRFQIALAGRDRLPVGMHDLYAHVPGHGGGVRFLGYVAPRGTTAIAVDVDGTLTESEDAIFNTVLFGDDIATQPDAPRALAAAGRPVIYVTSRGDQYTEVTRRWLAAHGFPRGPLRLARAAITRPGPRTVAFKTDVLRSLRVPLAAGIGNRASDIAAYTNAGLSPRQILINLPEFAAEVRADLAAGRATAFDDYRELPALLGPGAARSP